MFARAALVVAMALASGGCANGPCRRLREPQLAEGQAAAAARAQQAQQQMSPSAQTQANAGAAAGVAGGPGGTGANGTQPATGANGGNGQIGGLIAAKRPEAIGGPSPSATVFVYKADGSLQCGSAKGLSLQEMEKQLRGIPVLSRDKRPDGKMHIQVCGSPTGMINVYEIPETSFSEAESRSFKKL